MSSTVSIFLTLAGSIPSFERCTEAIGLDPTKTWCKKPGTELIPNQIDPSQFELLPDHQWSIGLEKRGLQSIDDAVVELLVVLEGHEAQIREFARKEGLRLTVSCTVTIYEDRPVYELQLQQVRALADLGASFVLDIYDYSEE